MAQQRAVENVEFIVKADQDLVLEGDARTIVRVQKGHLYSCLMSKTQRFSSLFRHYAKHHGLQKDKLVYFFTSEVHADATPESLHLQRHDIILVRAKEDPAVQLAKPDDEAFRLQLKSVFDDETFHDIKFLVGPSKAEITAHKAILAARSDYFAGLFSGNFSEASHDEIVIDNVSYPTFRRVLEFIYGNRLPTLAGATPDDVIELLTLADQYLLPNLRALVEDASKPMIRIDNVLKLLHASQSVGADALTEQCMNFVFDNVEEALSTEEFTSDLRRFPELAVSVLQFAAPKLRPRKRARMESDASVAGIPPM